MLSIRKYSSEYDGILEKVVRSRCSRLLVRVRQQIGNHTCTYLIQVNKLASLCFTYESTPIVKIVDVFD